MSRCIFNLLKCFEREVWSRRISHEDRLVYVVYSKEKQVEIILIITDSGRAAVRYPTQSRKEHGGSVFLCDLCASVWDHKKNLIISDF
ncbi:MAG: hypothetical protein B6245_13340 [Desulfobacteraceae bacterium 4572_88]|nr:MAG: hypothetical protein B6245_13340 [Desulfobacteraceae bacterium 4572_88]